MNNKSFDEIVKARANERVQKKIEAFKNNVSKECATLAGRPYTSPLHSGDKKWRELLFALMSKGHQWPSWLWYRECDVVAKELLATMDEMKRALVAAEKSEPGKYSMKAADDE